MDDGADVDEFLPPGAAAALPAAHHGGHYFEREKTGVPSKSWPFLILSRRLSLA